MKKFVTFIAIVIACLFAVQAANYTSYSITLIKTYNDEPTLSKGPDKGGHRTPPMPIPCTVSVAEGITAAIDEADIITYEIWDVEGEECIAVYANDTDAANHIFANPGEYQLCIITNEYSYIGYITTL